jgi:hypothetical protein
MQKFMYLETRRSTYLDGIFLFSNTIVHEKFLGFSKLHTGIFVFHTRLSCALEKEFNLKFFMLSWGFCAHPALT